MRASRVAVALPVRSSNTLVAAGRPSCLSKARLKRVSSRPARGLLVRGSSPVSHTVQQAARWRRTPGRSKAVQWATVAHAYSRTMSLPGPRPCVPGRRGSRTWRHQDCALTMLVHDWRADHVQADDAGAAAAVERGGRGVGAREERRAGRDTK